MTALRQTDRARSERAYVATAMIGELVARLHNTETGIETLAVKAAEEGRPAYWRRGNYSQAAHALFCITANSESLAAALAQWVDPTHPGKTPEAMLASLIPINTLAAIQLQGARDRAYWDAAPGARSVA